MPKFKEEKQTRKVNALHRKEEEDLAKLLAQRHNLAYVNLEIFPIELDALKIITEDESIAGEMAIIRESGKNITVALHKPDKNETHTILERLKEDGYTAEFFYASKSSLEHAWEIYRKIPAPHEMSIGTIQISNERIKDIIDQIKTVNELRDRINATFASRISESLETILAGSLAIDASDIHIEPQQDIIRLRFRLDGVLHDIAEIPQRTFHLLLSRIKLVSELKLNIHDRAQDGRFTIKTGDTDIEVRTSTLPGPNGENIVLRVLNPKSIDVKIQDLGMQPWIEKSILAELNRPNGMILTTGPTGSGKTTSLYTFLRTLYNPTIKIITIEDPIEYHLKGLEQTQVDKEKGYDFANGLRSIVRQDPDVVLVGEIRDFETAETAMHAALTGHLVFSTLHTNDAAGTIPRLIDLGVKPAIIAPALNVAIAQRLLRKLCVHCKQPSVLTNEQLKFFGDELKLFPKGVPIPEPNDWHVAAAHAEGCDTCNYTGYKGRIGIFELIFIDETIERLILKEPSEFEIKKAAFEQAEITMRQDGILKVLAGISDYEELERVVGT